MTGPLDAMVLGWSEKEFQQQVVETARALRWMAFHQFDSRRSEPGWPDSVLIHRGKGLLLFRELKTERGRTTAKQDECLAGLESVGQDVGVWRPRDWVSRRIHAELAGKRVGDA